MGQTFTSQPNSYAGVRGKSIISHRLRLMLNLTMEEYALADLIFTFNAENKVLKLTFPDFHTRVGIQDNAKINSILKSLNEKGICIKPEGQRLQTTELWNKHFDVNKDFDNEDPDNPGFWQIFKKIGNKQEAMDKYLASRKIADKDTLHNAAVKYIKSKAGSERKFIMHASKFLNPAKKHWEDDFNNDESLEDSNTFKGTFE